MRREIKRDYHKTPLLIVGRVLRTSIVVQGKGLEGGGKIEGTKNSKSVD